MIKLYLKNKIYDITDCITPQIEFTKRCDMAFGSGAFDMEVDQTKLDFASNNIPPYTLIDIDDVQYLCSSQCNTVVPRENIYIHNVTLASLDTILPCFIVGTKYFSKSDAYGLDSKKIDILFEIVTNRTFSNYKIQFDSAFDKTVFNQQIEHEFGAGSTLWDALVEIANYYNYRPVVKSITYANESYVEELTSTTYKDDTVVINVSFIDLSNPDTITITKKDVVTQEIKTQKSDDYCRYLETEANNVVDTNTLTKAYNVAMTSDELRFTEDNMYLKLPSKIESVKNIWFKVYIPTPTIQIYKQGNFELLDAETEMSYSDVIAKYPAVERVLKVYLKDYLIGIADVPAVLNALKFNTQAKEYIQITPVSASLDYYINATKYLMEKSEWDLLTTWQQLKYAYYINGEDGIYNMFGYMDTGIAVINLVESALRTTFMNNILNSVQIDDKTNNKGYHDSETDIYYQVYFKFNGLGTDTYDPSNYTFDVEYYPIANPFLVVEKDLLTDPALNESYYKKISRTYGNSANKIDFDRVFNSMKKNNEALGKVERNIEIDGNVLGFDITNVPLKVIYDYDTYYLLCYTLTVTSSSRTYNLYLVRDYNTIASAIGVSTQFNVLKNPVDTEVERPLYFYAEHSGELSTTDNYAMLIKGTGCTEGLIRCAIMNYDGDYIFFASAIDSYSIGSYHEKVKGSDNTDRIYMLDFPYGNSNNEADNYEVSLIKITSTLSLKDSVSLPNIPEDLEYTTIATFSKNVYKDKREKLTFTIHIKDTTYTG